MNCPNCKTLMEVKKVPVNGAVADRLFCSKCGKSYTEDDLRITDKDREFLKGMNVRWD